MLHIHFDLFVAFFSGRLCTFPTQKLDLRSSWTPYLVDKLHMSISIDGFRLERLRRTFSLDTTASPDGFPDMFSKKDPIASCGDSAQNFHLVVALERQSYSIFDSLARTLALCRQHRMSCIADQNDLSSCPCTERILET